MKEIKRRVREEERGIDNFAFRRRKAYGTIMVDIDTHCVIDLFFIRAPLNRRAWIYGR